MFLHASGVRLSLSDSGDRRRATDMLTVRAVGTLFGNDEHRDELARAAGKAASVARGRRTKSASPRHALDEVVSAGQNGRSLDAS